MDEKNTSERLSDNCETTEIINETLDYNAKNEMDCADTDRIRNFNDESSLSSDEESFGKRVKRRIKRFSDSDEGEVEADNETGSATFRKSPTPEFIENGRTDESNSGTNTLKSRFRKISSSDSGSDSDQRGDKSLPSDGKIQEVLNETRIGNKKNKLKQKFQSLLSSRSKEKETANNIEKLDSETSSDENDTIATSIHELKEKIREKTMNLKSSLYDPDTSDEESIPQKNVKKRERKMTKPTSPKPMRMSAKQAMENMQKIKSESNRMLREKEVSLPYHRPKALSLKDILSRRRPAVSSDGKVLPIKMNEQQLKQYVQHLEQRQKEVIELCKSESEEEEEVQDNDNTDKEEELQDNDNTDKVATQNDTLFDDMSKSIANTSSGDCKLDNDDDVNECNKTENVANEELDKSSDIIQQDVIENCDFNVEGSSVVDVPIPEESKGMPEDKCQTELLQKEDANSSEEMELLYHDSIEEKTDEVITETDTDDNVVQKSTDCDSELLVLHYDTEKTEVNSEAMIIESSCPEIQLNNENIEPNINTKVNNEDSTKESAEDNGNMFSDDDMNMDDIDALIENAEVIASQVDNVDSPMLIKDKLLNSKPKITGAPGMVIDLDGTDPLVPRKLTGVDLLKERFAYFSKLKTPEEMKREREKIIKPGTQHLKLKQQLEEQIAEQRSLEWTKRLEAEKRHQQEMEAVIGNGSDAEEDIDKIEAKLEQTHEDVENESSSVSDEEEVEEMDVEIKDKPRKRNPMVDDEAEESDCDEVEEGQEVAEGNVEELENDALEADDEQNESDDESTDESEESDTEQEKPRKGRILKAFEDSDDEENSNKNAESIRKLSVTEDNVDKLDKEEMKDTQDVELQLAQVPKSLSEELFTSQESHTKLKDDDKDILNNSTETNYDKEVNTQTFSILESSANTSNVSKCDDLIKEKHYSEDNLDAAVALCSGRFSQTQNLLTPTQTQEKASQLIGDDVLALCTGNFYDNKFVSQTDSQYDEIPLEKLNTPAIEAALALPENSEFITLSEEQAADSISENISSTNIYEQNQPAEKREDQNLKSILDELNDPEFDAPKTYKYFAGNDVQHKEIKSKSDITSLKKKFVIESDEEDGEKAANEGRKRKIKRRKLENRALQISDDEEEQQQSDIEGYASEKENDGERLVEYDDEENEILVQPQNVNPKKKRKIAEFFENEAELTSEDEWIGSGDEDERGLDRMEREDGDDDTFNQNQLQRELGQIHMRDVLDKDKREVRLIQELLFEDGDLGEGHRQRKFRWRDADGEDGTGIPFGDVTDTQEEEFESEEQWRKQRHEREMFLKTLQEQEGAESNISMSRTSLIKANLTKNSTSIFTEINSNTTIESPVNEKKTNKDIPSPKKPFTIFQQNYHGSLLTRGRGALARLAALATPLAVDDDAPRLGSLAPSSKRNFVFAALDAVQQKEPKVIKRKADNNLATPKLVKKMKTEEKKPNQSKSNLLDHLKLL